jgi:N-ethylmaleimide reductase
MTKPNLFSPLAIGDLTLPNRVVMAPLTRNRARPDGDVPHALNATYYAQRASAGLIISEASQISPEGKGYAWTPGIYSPAQVAGWRLTTDAVHAKGGRIFLQLWHVGRISHTSLQPGGIAPVAPSAITAKAMTFDGKGFVPTSQPRALSAADIERVVADYRRAAENARTAGFDGVELHAANGYLLDQFLRDGTNKRDDQYGGSVQNRARIVMETLRALASVWPTNRIGIRFSPFSAFGDITDNDPMTTFGYVIEQVSGLGLGYLHMIEGETGGARTTPDGTSIAGLRRHFKGAYMANNGYDRALAVETIANGGADLIAFGKPYIANPDLVARLEQGALLSEPDQATFYGGAEKGYTDYPALNQA